LTTQNSQKTLKTECSYKAIKITEILVHLLPVNEHKKSSKMSKFKWQTIGSKQNEFSHGFSAYKRVPFLLLLHCQSIFVSKVHFFFTILPEILCKIVFFGTMTWVKMTYFALQNCKVYRFFFVIKVKIPTQLFDFDTFEISIFVK